MAFSTTTARRRAARLVRPAKMAKATRSFHKAMGDFMLASALAPLAGLAHKPAKAKNPVVVKPRAGRTLKPRPRVKAKPVAPPVPDGAQYLTRRHRSASGARVYRLYLPASHPKRPRGLILMLHGCSQTPDDFALGTHMNALAEKHGLAVAYPAQSKADNAAACWNWFKPDDQTRGSGEPAMLAALMRKLAKDLRLGRDACFVAGLSAGGAMAAILADVYPDVFAAAGVHSGLPRGAAKDVMSAMTAMRRGGTQTDAAPAVAGHAPVRRIVFHGDSDSTVHPSNAAMIVAAAVGGDTAATKVSARSVRGRDYARSLYTGPDGTVLELWLLQGAGHAWSGGRAAGSFTDRKGPDASAQMIRFFLEKPA